MLSYHPRSFAPEILGPRGGTGLRSGLKIRRSEDLVGSNPTEGIHTIRTLKNVDRDFFRTWTPDMAYVLGYIVADGLCCVTQRKGRENRAGSGKTCTARQAHSA